MARRIVLILVLLAAIGGAIYYAHWSRPREIVLTGIVTTDDVIVSAQMQGRVQKLLVKQGDTVKQGDVVALIEPSEMRADAAFFASSERQAATQVSQAQADLRYQQEQTKNQIAQAQANALATEAQLQEGEVNLESVRRTFVRTENAYKSGAETLQAYDLSRMAYEGQRAHVESLKKQLQAARATIDLAKSNENLSDVRQAAVEVDTHALAAAGAQGEKAKVRLGYTEVKSPISGIVDKRAALQGEVVNPTQAIITLIDQDDLWVRGDVEEGYIDRIHLGDKLTVRLPSGAERAGVVFYRAVNADYATQRDVSRTKRDIKTFEIRLRCDNADRSLAVGMTASVILPLEKQP